MEKETYSHGHDNITSWGKVSVGSRLQSQKALTIAMIQFLLKDTGLIIKDTRKAIVTTYYNPARFPSNGNLQRYIDEDGMAVTLSTMHSGE